MVVTVTKYKVRCLFIPYCIPSEPFCAILWCVYPSQPVPFLGVKILEPTLEI